MSSKDILTKAVYKRKQTVAGDDGERSEGCEAMHSQVIDDDESIGSQIEHVIVNIRSVNAWSRNRCYT